MDKFTRRETLRIGLAGAAAASGLAGGNAAAEAATEATGFVYVERAGGARTPLPGTLVSNGREVVAADRDGRWRLPAPAPCVFFVIKPAGFMVPVDPVTGSP